MRRNAATEISTGDIFFARIRAEARAIVSSARSPAA
jgi:hypothetical protein